GQMAKNQLCELARASPVHIGTRFGHNSARIFVLRFSPTTLFIRKVKQKTDCLKPFDHDDITEDLRKIQ
ncbi:MAG: hypothetical protein AAF098_07500, partial [Pseudomonadota bacterium]